MTKRPLNAAFTLIEVLIVVVIMAILAGTIISRLLNTADDAKASALQHNLSVAETQIVMYRAQHNSRYPTIQDQGLPQLLSPTNASGEIGPAGPQHPFGPYLLEAPMNPYDGSKKVVPVAAPGKKPAGVVGSSGGWQYDETTGALWPNHAEYYQ